LDSLKLGDEHDKPIDVLLDLEIKIEMKNKSRLLNSSSIGKSFEGQNISEISDSTAFKDQNNNYQSMISSSEFIRYAFYSFYKQ